MRELILLAGGTQRLTESKLREIADHINPNEIVSRTNNKLVLKDKEYKAVGLFRSLEGYRADKLLIIGDISYRTVRDRLLPIVLNDWTKIKSIDFDYRERVL